ncbi:MAG: patatin-like phospholipase family protein [Thermomonas sp.]|nr:MAG: patatin-like phospholipase family protein [Thermomonas sp.]
MLACLLPMLLAGCATYGRIDNQPLTSAAARQPGYGMSEAASAGRRDDITLVLAFSGGGSRAAALAYGVLLELRDTRIGANGDRRLLDEVDAISAVSGGSFTAAYYGLHGDDTFRDFESGFLRRDLTSDVLQRILSPRRWFTPEGRSDAASTLYDGTIFKGATFADLQRRNGPLIVINASDLEGGIRFAFLQEFFDLLCSDLRSYPLADAVAASSAVPVLFEPVVLQNNSGCAAPHLPQPAEDSPQLQQVVEGLRGYADKQQRHYVHLADGGLTDNLGLRAFQETIDLAGGLRPFLRKIGREPNGHVVVVSVDASGKAAEGLGLERRAPSMLRAVDIMSDVQLHRYNAATLEQMQDSLQRWAKDVSTPERKVQPRLVTVALRDVVDEAERQRLSRISTNFDLEGGQVDALVAAGRALLRANPEFRGLLDALGGKPAN